MPIRPENKGLYPKDWPAISRRIRDAAGKCEWCRAPNGEVVARGSDGTYMLEDGRVFDAVNGNYLGVARGSEYPMARMTRIVLTTAHLNHDPSDCRDSNLRALCQKCHLGYDRDMHRAERERRRRKAKACGDLFKTGTSSTD